MELTIKRVYKITYEVRYASNYCDCGGIQDWEVLDTFEDLEKALLFVESSTTTEELTINVVAEGA